MYNHILLFITKLLLVLIDLIVEELGANGLFIAVRVVFSPSQFQTKIQHLIPCLQRFLSGKSF